MNLIMFCKQNIINGYPFIGTDVSISLFHRYLQAMEPLYIGNKIKKIKDALKGGLYLL